MTTTEAPAITDQLSATKLLEDYKALKKGRERTSIANANWVTTLSHECEAYAVYNRTVPPSQRRPLKESLGMIFAEGNDQARAIKRDLFDMGYDVEGAEDQMSWPKYQITGRQDLKIRKSGVRHSVYAEIKSCAPYTFDKLHTVEDLKTTVGYVQKWYSQVAMYMVLRGVERYWLILKNKSTGQVKILEFQQNDDILQAAERMLKKAEKTNYLVQLGKMPTPDMKISTPDLCSECEFQTVCLPEMNFGLAAKVMTDELGLEMERKAERLIEIKPLADEYKELDDDLKGTVKGLCADGGDSVVFGSFVATIKRSPRKQYTVAATTTERVTFVKVGG